MTRRYVLGLGLGLTVLLGVAPLRAQAAPDDRRAGTVAGIVTDARSGTPIAEARVTVDGRFSTMTDETGRYLVTGLHAGRRVVTVRAIGYASVTRAIDVADYGPLTVNVALEPAPTRLDEVVVTGAVAPTEVRALPTPITVLTADELEARGISRINQLFRGDVPGIVSTDLGMGEDVFGADVYVRGSTAFYASNNRLKTYVDGVELTDPRLLNNLNPDAIERIEIVRGPQASTLYGSRAMAGVMQIFTKRGTIGRRHARLEATLSSGLLESGSRDGATAQHDYAVAVSGGTEESSYQLGASYQYVGAWVPEASSRLVGIHGGLRWVFGNVTASLSGRVDGREFSNGPEPFRIERIVSGAFRYDPTYLVPQHYDYARPHQTLGLTLTYTPRSWWRHSLTVGHAQERFEWVQREPRFRTPADSLRVVLHRTEVRPSVAYHTVVQRPLAEALHGTVTLGGDWWTHSGGQYQALNAKNVIGDLQQSTALLQRFEDEHVGLFGQVQLGWHEAVFLTAGVRVDHNASFDEDRTLAYSPRIGLSVVRDVGPLSAKLRAAYGSALRPPTPVERLAVNYPTGAVYLAPDRLGPERQVGGDVGLELYYGDRASLEVTYYNQLAKDMITPVWLNEPETPTVFQYQNLGAVRNKGWEVQGTVRLGAVHVGGTYSTFDSRIEELDGSSSTFEIGQRVTYIAPYSAAVTVTYARPAMTIAVGTTVLGPAEGLDDVAYYSSAFDRLTPGGVYDQRAELPTVTRYHARIRRRITERIDAFVNVENLANDRTASNSTGARAVKGRSTMVGLRLH